MELHETIQGERIGTAKTLRVVPSNPNDPATQNDLLDLRQGVKQDLLDLEDRLTEKMRDMQTEVLRAFHDWARTIETRLRVLPLVDERLTILEDRVSRIERGDRPPH